MSDGLEELVKFAGGGLWEADGGEGLEYLLVIELIQGVPDGHT